MKKIILWVILFLIIWIIVWNFLLENNTKNNNLKINNKLTQTWVIEISDNYYDLESIWEIKALQNINAEWFYYDYSAYGYSETFNSETQQYETSDAEKQDFLDKWYPKSFNAWVYVNIEDENYSSFNHININFDTNKINSNNFSEIKFHDWFKGKFEWDYITISRWTHNCESMTCASWEIYLNISSTQETIYLLKLLEKEEIVTWVTASWHTKYNGNNKSKQAIFRKKYPDAWIENQDFIIKNNTIRFTHIYYGKTFVCNKWKLFINYNAEQKEIFTSDNTESDFWPCTFNVSQTSDENIFLIDFCLSWLGSSWECFGTNMYYDVDKNTWKEWDLFFIWYENEKRVKTLLSETNVDIEPYKKEYDDFIECMNKNNFTYCYFQ